ncbi:unnamed protein product [Amoebophrya sp. A120]|nr:unnamed protein product [Amoebophrya sp. A120]|eukprot:GSA120T00015338001.1
MSSVAGPGESSNYFPNSHEGRLLQGVCLGVVRDNVNGQRNVPAGPHWREKLSKNSNEQARDHIDQPSHCILSRDRALSPHGSTREKATLSAMSSLSPAPRGARVPLLHDTASFPSSSGCVPSPEDVPKPRLADGCSNTSSQLRALASVVDSCVLGGREQVTRPLLERAIPFSTNLAVKNQVNIAGRVSLLHSRLPLRTATDAAAGLHSAEKSFATKQLPELSIAGALDEGQGAPNLHIHREDEESLTTDSASGFEIFIRTDYKKSRSTAGAGTSTAAVGVSSPTVLSSWKTSPRFALRQASSVRASTRTSERGPDPGEGNLPPRASSGDLCSRLGSERSPALEKEELWQRIPMAYATRAQHQGGSFAEPRHCTALPRVSSSSHPNAVYASPKVLDRTAAVAFAGGPASVHFAPVPSPKSTSSDKLLLERLAPSVHSSSSVRPEAAPRGSSLGATSIAQRLQTTQADPSHSAHERRAVRMQLQKANEPLAQIDNFVSLYEVVSENAELRKELQDIKRFLADYGLTWVGGSPEDGVDRCVLEEEAHHRVGKSIRAKVMAAPPLPAEQRSRLQEASNTSPTIATVPETERSQEAEGKALKVSPSVNAMPGRPPERGREAPAVSSSPSRRQDETDARTVAPTVDIGLIQRKVTELSGLVEREAKIVQVGPQGGTRLHQFESERLAQLIFFQDGLRLEGHPFYKYEHSTAQRVLRDVLDGYFPYLLKSDYPNGVCLQVVDRLNEDYHSHEIRLASRAVQEKFLDLLPKQVILANGQIVPIRQEMEERLLSKNERDAVRLPAANPAELRSNSAQTARRLVTRTMVEEQTPGCKTTGATLPVRASPLKAVEHTCSARARRDDCMTQAGPSGGEAELGASFCSILVKHRNGACRVSLPKQATVAELYQAAKAKLHLSHEDPSSVLKCAFPPPTRLFADTKATLEVMGLFPNGTVHLG